MTDALLADAQAFARTVDPRSRAGVELEGLVASGALPIDREEQWHAVASLLVVDGSGSILLARNASGGWGTCGGHIEPDDSSIRAAVVREAQEELGLELDPSFSSRCCSSRTRSCSARAMRTGTSATCGRPARR